MWGGRFFAGAGADAGAGKGDGVDAGLGGECVMDFLSFFGDMTNRKYIAYIQPLLTGDENHNCWNLRWWKLFILFFDPALVHLSSAVAPPFPSPAS